MNHTTEVIFCFIVLHYQAIEDTIVCVDSIKQIADPAEAKIILVDNASPNGSGHELETRYQDDRMVVLCLNKENVGFSQANNVACRIAREQFQPLYYIVCNNDIEFIQDDFCERIREIDRKTPFSILGPDVQNTHSKRHQSPVSFDTPSVKRVNKTIILNIIALKLMPLSYPLLRNWFRRVDNEGQEWWDTACEDVVLSGACMIFSERYVEARESNVFSPETFFYYEEYIITEWCRRNGHRILYQPSLVVNHNDSGATRTRFKKDAERYCFRMRNLIASARVYREYCKQLVVSHTFQRNTD